MVKAMAPVYKGKKQPTMFAAVSPWKMSRCVMNLQLIQSALLQADNKTHAKIRRPVASAYSMSNVIQVSFGKVFKQSEMLTSWLSSNRSSIKTRRYCTRNCKSYSSTHRSHVIFIIGFNTVRESQQNLDSPLG